MYGMKEIRKVCVVGGGLMGRQIALNTAMYGYEVKLTDTVKAVLDNTEEWIKGYLAERVKKGKLSETEASEIQRQIQLVTMLEAAAKDADLVIEAIVEDRQKKEELFAKISGIVGEDTIITTNSSYMGSSAFAPFVKNPSRLANLHYFNPALVMKLTEIVQGPYTSKETVDALMEFAKKSGKQPVWLRKEIDGFIANRIVRAVTNEALYILSEEIATPQEIDTAVEKGLNYPMGPFRLQDLTGIDLAYIAAKQVADETGHKKPGFDMLEQKFVSGEYGRKTGKGWYEY